MEAQALATAHAHTYLQSLKPIQTMHPFVVHLPAFTPEQDMNALAAEPRSTQADLPNTPAQRRLILRRALLVPPRATEPS
jgi:hypothetical protein